MTLGALHQSINALGGGLTLFRCFVPHLHRHCKEVQNTDVMLKTHMCMFLCKAIHYDQSSKHVDTDVDVFTVVEKNSSMS